MVYDSGWCEVLFSDVVLYGFDYSMFHKKLI